MYFKDQLYLDDRVIQGQMIVLYCLTLMSMRNLALALTTQPLHSKVNMLYPSHILSNLGFT